MKNVTKILAAVAVLGFTTTSYAQQTSSATATASATIITPISISKDVDLNFGNIAVSATTPGTVVYASATNTRTPSGGVTLPATSGSPARAKFTVTGQASYTYGITLPSSDVTIDDNASHTMAVNAFSSFPSSTGLLTGGTQDLYVGATLNVAAAQATGTYVSDAAFTVTVNYN